MRPKRCPEDSGQEKTRYRARDGHQELGLGIGRFAFHFGYATEDEQCNAANRHAVITGDDRVGKLVKYDREENANRDGNTHPGIGMAGEFRVMGRKPARAQ